MRGEVLGGGGLVSFYHKGTEGRTALRSQHILASPALSLLSTPSPFSAGGPGGRFCCEAPGAWRGGRLCRLQSPEAETTTQPHVRLDKKGCFGEGRGDGFPPSLGVSALCHFAITRESEKERETPPDAETKGGLSHGVSPRQASCRGSGWSPALPESPSRPAPLHGARPRTWEFWIRIVPGDKACVTTWPWGVTTVTG